MQCIGCGSGAVSERNERAATTPPAADPDFLDAAVMNKPEVMVSQITAKVDAGTGTPTDQPTRDLIAAQLKAFTAFTRRSG
jgi:hypothetical protein